MTTSREPVHFFVVGGKTVFMPLKYIYPECWFHIKDSPQLSPMKCFVENACPPGPGACADILVKRVHYLFNEVVPDAELLIAYFKYGTDPGIQGVKFWSTLEAPVLGRYNPWAFKKYQKEGVAYTWMPKDEYLFMGGSTGLVSISGLTAK